MNRVWEDVFALAEDQHGAFTYAQTIEVGGDAGWLQRARRDRLVERIMRGAYGVVALLDEWSVLAAAQLVQPRSVAGFSSAALLQRYDGVDWSKGELLVPRGHRVRGLVT